jgi:diguanylate cyclase (GGDEF)-like protein/PAS domain S-box-containing protein
MVVAGLGAGAVATLSARWQCACLFQAPALLPFVIRFVHEGGSGAMMAGALIVLFLVVVMAMSIRTCRQVSAYLASTLDSRRRFEQRTRERERFRSLIESMQAVIWEADPESRDIHFISSGAQTLFGAAPDGFIGNASLFDEMLDERDRDLVAEALDWVKSGETDVSFECRFRGRDDEPVWVRANVRRIRVPGNGETLVGVMMDIGDRKRAERHLNYVSGLQELMVETSRRLLRSRDSDIEAVVSDLLAKVGGTCGADRAYLLRFSDDLSSLTNTHEWVAAGVAPQRGRLQEVETADFPALMSQLQSQQRVLIDDVERLGPGWELEREMLRDQDIRSLVCIPIMRSGHLVGMVGFDAVRSPRQWESEEVALLNVVGDLIGEAMARSESDRALRSSELRRAYAESLAGMGSWEWDIENDRFFASEEWRKLTGLHDAELDRDRVLQLTPPEERGMVESALSRAMESDGPYDLEHRMVRADNGETIWVRVHAEMIRNDGERPRLRGFAQDISAQKDAEARLFRMAHFDALTSLPNRSLLLDRLDQAVRRLRRIGSGVGVLFIDLDHFKKVNDTLGHEAGDRVLLDAASRLREVVREMDTVARIGGDEFIVLVEDVKAPDALAVIAEKILRVFLRPFELDDRQITLTASIGISTCVKAVDRRGDADCPQILMRNADTAMYQAKAEGRNSYRFFTADMNAAVNRRLTVEEALRGVLARDELTVVYQPLIEIGTGRVMGAESLSRWHHPELGAVSPDEFIPLAEQAGLIDDIGEFVFRCALAEVAHWREASDMPVAVSVNVSPRQFRDAGLPVRLERMLNANGVPPEALDIEVTEGVLLDTDERTLKILRELRELGVGLVMDDFGTGYASLRYLRDHPFNALKIDRDFIRDVDSDSRHRQLVTSALQLGQSLKMKVVAEGVETGRELEVLRGEGCSLAQGYLFSPPVEAERIRSWLRSGHAFVSGHP